MTKALAAAAAVLAAFPLFLILLVTASTGTPAQAVPAATGLAGTPTALARGSIPADYLAWYMAAAKTCPGLPWSVLAGIGEAESGHGRSALPGVRSGSNRAGAEGPMQLEPSTFGRSAFGPPGSDRSSGSVVPTCDAGDWRHVKSGLVELECRHQERRGMKERQEAVQGAGAEREADAAL